MRDKLLVWVAEQLAVEQGPPGEQVGDVLPGLADPAVDLHHRLGTWRATEQV